MIRDVAAGVPFVAVPPVNPSPVAPVVLGWHLLDPPRTEAAFAAAVPLAGLDAWRIYLGLPMTGSRLPPGGFEEVMRLAFDDAVLNVYGPMAEQVADEVAAAWSHLQSQLGIGDGPVGVLGGSFGAAAAQLVIAEGLVDAKAAVLVSPLVQLRPMVEAMGRRFGVSYQWSAPSLAVARRLDFVERAGEIAAHGQPAVLLVVGADDDPDAFVGPATQLRDELRNAYDDAARVELVTVPGMAHALAEEPGTEPEPQTPHAAEVDRHAATWLARHLGAAVV